MGGQKKVVVGKKRSKYPEKEGGRGIGVVSECPT